jgi:hypothetical protein
MEIESKINKQNIAIVYVILGTNPVKNFYNYLEFTKKKMPQAKYFLITDNPELWESFPGFIVLYSKDLRTKEFKKFLKKHSYLGKIAGGYWLYTLERIFTLRLLQNYLPDNTLIIHLESDVILWLKDSEIDVVKSNLNHFSIPRYSDTEGIASIMLSPSVDCLVKTLDELELILINKSDIDNDMVLLGKALSEGLIKELPSREESDWLLTNGNRLIFDGLAMGQYLFGRYPLHSENKILRGFLNPTSKKNLNQAEWKTSNQGDLVFRSDSISYQVANLHIHSKDNIPDQIDEAHQWEEILLEANGKLPHEIRHVQQEDIHIGEYSLLTKFRIARREGLIPYLSRKIRNTWPKSMRKKNQTR